MDDQDQATNPETPETEPQEVVTTEAAQGAEEELSEGERQSPAEEETEEVDWDGLKLTLPKTKAQEWRDGWLRQADYTRKTQEAAERRRALDAEEAERSKRWASREEQAKADEAVLDHRAELKALEKALADYTPDVWNALQQRDATNGTNETQAHLLRIRQLESQRDQVKSKIAEAQDKRTREAAAEAAKRNEEARQTYQRQVMETQAVLAKEIGWNKDLAEKTERFGLEQGLTSEELGIMAADPRFVRLVHFARLGIEATRKQKQAVTQAKQTPPPQPVEQVRPTRATPSKGLNDRDDMATWMKKRNDALHRKSA